MTTPSEIRRIFSFIALLLWVSACTSARAQTTSQSDYPPLDSIHKLPIAKVRTVFHFVGSQDGRNFVSSDRDFLFLAYGGHEKLRADVLMYYLMGELNKRFRTALLDYPTTRDSRFRFVYYYGDDDLIANARFYEHDEGVDYVPDALNIVFTDRGRPRGKGRGATASTGRPGSNVIKVYGQLENYLAGSHDTWTVGRAIAHEFGHTLALDHTFKCDNPCAGQGFTPTEECFGDCVGHNAGSGNRNCYGGSQRGLMMGYGEEQLHLTECEVKRMWTNYLLRKERMAWVVLTD